MAFIQQTLTYVRNKIGVLFISVLIAVIAFYAFTSAPKKTLVETEKKINQLERKLKTTMTPTPSITPTLRPFFAPTGAAGSSAVLQPTSTPQQPQTVNNNTTIQQAPAPTSAPVPTQAPQPTPTQGLVCKTLPILCN